MPAFVASCSAAETAPLTPRHGGRGGAVIGPHSTDASERAPASEWPATAQAAGGVAGERRERSCGHATQAPTITACRPQQRAGAVTVTAGAAVLLVGTFLTWLRSGATERSSYDVFDLVDRLGFSEGGLVGWALRLWPLVPLLLVLTVIAWWFPASGSGVDRNTNGAHARRASLCRCRRRRRRQRTGCRAVQRRRWADRDTGRRDRDARRARPDRVHRHSPRASSTSFSTCGRSVMMPSTPRSSRRVISSGSSIVQTWTW